MSSNEFDLQDVQPAGWTPLHTLRHSAAHVLADAVKRLYPHAKLTVGPPTENGFYYDFDVPVAFTDEDLARIEQEMQSICDRDLPFVRREVSRTEALALFEQLGESYKVQIAQSIPEGQTLTVYQHGDFVDLCRGPHVQRTGQIGALKLLSVAGAYFRGDAKGKMLSRIYGTAFSTRADLDAYLHQLEEAKRRDHRKLGRELELFHFDPLAPGAVFWLPRGTVVWNALSQWMRDNLTQNGYCEVRTPLVFNKKLWERSGHWSVYRDNMFLLQSEEQEFGLKPMNCPAHMLIFGSRKRSYRELPLRLHDQGVLHRNEASGTLGGLTRVRQFCQDDVHLFLMPEQMGAEVNKILDLIDRVYGAFGLAYAIKLSTRDPAKMIGDAALWDRAEAELRTLLEARGVPYREEAGEGAFYGPKIDFDVTDALGRKWQCATVQLDFQQPIRFELEFVGPDGQMHRPIVIHQAILGSFERFLAILIEHYAGAFPTWLAPVQVKVMGVSQKQDAFVAEVDHQLRRAGVRVEADLTEDKLGAKIRRAQLEKTPYMLVVGDKEMAAGLVSPRLRDGTQLEPCTVEQLILRLTDEIKPPRI